MGWIARLVMDWYPAKSRLFSLKIWGGHVSLHRFHYVWEAGIAHGLEFPDPSSSSIFHSYPSLPKKMHLLEVSERDVVAGAYLDCKSQSGALSTNTISCPFRGFRTLLPVLHQLGFL